MAASDCGKTWSRYILCTSVKVNNGSINSKGYPASTDCLSVFDHFVGLALKGLNFKAESKVASYIYSTLTSY